MAGRFIMPERKTLAAIIIIAILLVTAITGTVVFLKTRGNAKAAEMANHKDEEQIVEQEQTSSQKGENQNQEAKQNQEQQETQTQQSQESENVQSNKVNANTEKNQSTNNNVVEKNNTTKIPSNTTSNDSKKTTPGRVINTPTVKNIEDIKDTTITKQEKVILPNQLVAKGEDKIWEPQEIKATFANTNKNLDIVNIISKKECVVTRNGQTIENAKKGDIITYTITLNNIGTIDGETLVKDKDLKDILNSVAKINEKPIIKDAEGQKEVNEEELINGVKVKVKANGIATITFSIEVMKAEGKIINKALTGEDETPTPPTEVDTTNVEVVKKVKNIIRNNEEVQPPVQLNDIVNYDITITNTGSTDKKVAVNDVLTSKNKSLDLYDGENKVTEITLKAGESKVLTAQYIVQQEDIDNQKEIPNLINVATIKYDDEEKNSKTETPIDEAHQNYESSKTAIITDAQFVKKDRITTAGDKVQYTIKIKNTGNTTIKDLMVKDEKIGEIINNSLVEVQGKAKAIDSDGTREIKIDDLIKGITINLNVGQEATVTFEVKITQKAIDNETQIKNIAIVGEQEPEKDIDIEKYEAEKTAIILDSNRAEKNKVTAAGDTVKYTITAKNTGNTVLKDLTIKDEKIKNILDNNLAIIQGKVTVKDSDGTREVEIQDLISGITAKVNVNDKATVEFEIKITQKAIDTISKIENIAIVGNKEPEKDIEIENNPSIDVKKDIISVTKNNETIEINENNISSVKANQDSTITYRIVATNDGNTTLNNVKVIDDKKVKLESVVLPERLNGTTITIGNEITPNTNLLGRDDITLEPQEKIIFTVSYKLSKSDVTGTNKTFKNWTKATGKHENKTPEDTDDVDINTEYTPTIGSKKFVKKWNDKNYESNRPKTIKIQLMKNGKEVGDPVEITADNWSYTFENLQLEDEQGNSIVYTVKEVTVPTGYTASKCTTNQNNELEITNTYIKPTGGTITQKYTDTNKVKVPLDVVFIVDTSQSMVDNKERAQNTITATNKAIAQIQGYNEYNRVAVLAFSGSYQWSTEKIDYTKMLDLGRYKANDGSNYLNLNGITMETNVKNVSKVKRKFEGGTYTQIGIAEGTKLLKNAKNKTIQIDGQEVTRQPIIILLSDGMPTYYTEAYTNVIQSNKVGDATEAKVNEFYGKYTIQSAKSYKDVVSQSYNKTAKMYTIGMGISETEPKNLFARTVLNPNTTNINSCKNADKYSKEYKLYQELSKITNYQYADGAEFGEFAEDRLANIMKSFIESSIPKQTTRNIEQTEIQSGKVYLTQIDGSKEFSLTAGGMKYMNFAAAQKDEIVLQDTNGEYYIDLSKLPAQSTITVIYTRK